MGVSARLVSTVTIASFTWWRSSYYIASTEWYLQNKYYCIKFEVCLKLNNFCTVLKLNNTIFPTNNHRTSSSGNSTTGWGLGGTTTNGSGGNSGAAGAVGITKGPGRDISTRKSNSLSTAFCNLKCALTLLTNYTSGATNKLRLFLYKINQVTSSASGFGGTGGGVTVIRFFAIGGGAVGNGGGGVSGNGIKPKGLCPLKPAV